MAGRFPETCGKIDSALTRLWAFSGAVCAARLGGASKPRVVKTAKIAGNAAPT